MAASTKAAEKRAIEVEQRLLELENAGGGRKHQYVARPYRRLLDRRRPLGRQGH
jgi:hypothetical protein